MKINVENLSYSLQGNNAKAAINTAQGFLEITL